MEHSMNDRYRAVVGWIAVAVSAVGACFWAFWGITENFHEGWYAASLWENLAIMIAQYLLAMVLFMAAGLIAIRWPRVGGGVHAGIAGLAFWFFRGSAPLVILPTIVLPVLLLGAAYWWGRPTPRRRAMLVLLVLPLLTLVAAGLEPAIRVGGRLDDGDRGTRHIRGNDVDLLWAPRGPGWPDDGVSWEESLRRCRYLSDDGSTLAATPQNLWRLPTVEEAVRSQSRHGTNCWGVWDTTHGVAIYRETPDKESPLWDLHSKVIYWWTATEVDSAHAYIIVYDGRVWSRPKNVHWGYLGFRAVRDAR